MTSTSDVGPICIPGSLSPKEDLSCPSCPLLLKVSPSPLQTLPWTGIPELCFQLNPTGLGMALGVLSRREEQGLILGCKNIPGAEKGGNTDRPQCLKSFNFTMALKCVSGHHPAHFFLLSGIKPQLPVSHETRRVPTHSPQCIICCAVVFLS